MAIAHVQDKKANGNSTSPITVTLDNSTVNGNLIEVTVAARQGANAGNISVTDNKGNTYSLAASSTGSANAGGFARFCMKFYAANITGGSSHQISVATAGGAYAGETHTIIAAEYSGLDTASPLDKTATGSGTSTTASAGPTAALAQADELVTCGVRANSTKTEDGSFTLVDSDGVGGDEYQIVSSTSAVTGTWGLSPSASWVCVLATYKAAAGGGGGNPWNYYAQAG